MTSVDMGPVGMEMKSICDGGDPWSVMWDSMKAGSQVGYDIEGLRRGIRPRATTGQGGNLSHVFVRFG